MIQEISLKNPVNGHRRFGLISEPKKPVAVMALCHGFGEHCARYKPMMEAHAQANIAAITLDLEGHGRSQGRKGVCRDYAILHGDVGLLLDEAKGRFPDVPVFLYGHSMGGGLVMHYVLTHRSERLHGVISSAPLIRSAIPVPALLFRLVKILRPLLPGATRRQAIPGEAVNSRAEAQAEYENDPLNHDRMGTGLGIDIIEAGEFVESNAAKWTAPLLLMHARGDQLTKFESSEAFAQAAQNCTFIAMENSEHEIHNDVTRNDVYAAMIDFIKARI